MSVVRQRWAHTRLSSTLLLMLLSVYGSRSQEAKPQEDDEAYTLHFNVPPPAVDPQLCAELRLKPDDASDTETSRRQKLLELCDKRKAHNATGSASPTDSHHVVRIHKRSLSKSKMEMGEQKMMLELHNQYRRSVKPEAANMKLMKWDSYLADTAQSWADLCIFEHGMPKDMKPGERLGQNLYVGNDPTGHRAMQMWFEEMDYYDYQNTECEPGELCGHYLQVTWAETEYVGCGKSKCVEHGHYIACHYRPHGNIPDMHPFLSGKPCSQCHSKLDGGLCFNKTCVTSSECKSMNLDCTCDLDCHNCADLRKSYCRCECKNGWDSLDCSRPCMDDHFYCGNSPGWPNVMSCSLENHKVRDVYCRKMCKQCKTTDSSQSKSTESDLCCNGTVCEFGYVLDARCQCQQLCPGPQCFGLISPEKTQSAPLNNYDVGTPEISASKNGGPIQLENDDLSNDHDYRTLSSDDSENIDNHNTTLTLSDKTITDVESTKTKPKVMTEIDSKNSQRGLDPNFVTQSLVLVIVVLRSISI